MFYPLPVEVNVRRLASLALQAEDPACPLPCGPCCQVCICHSLHVSHSRSGTVTMALGWPWRPCATWMMERKSDAMASKQPASSQRRLCWWTASQGGRSLGNSRHGAPARTSLRRALKTSRKSCSRFWECRSIKLR